MKQRPRVVTAPLMLIEIEAQKFGDRLCAALARYPVVIADLTHTWACDHAAIGEICAANELAAHSNRELRIVISSPPVLHQFAITGLEAELLIFESLSLAANPGPTTPERRLKWRRHPQAVAHGSKDASQ